MLQPVDCLPTSNPTPGKKAKSTCASAAGPERQVLLNGAAGRSRTGDLRITNALLYQLSYSGVGAHYKASGLKALHPTKRRGERKGRREKQKGKDAEGGPRMPEAMRRRRPIRPRRPFAVFLPLHSF